MIRDINLPIEIGGYTLQPGNRVAAPVWLAHYDEAIWGREGHPASTFYAERFLHTDQDGNSVFHNPAKPGQYFPFGGGSAACPGRFYAKNQIISAVAIFLWAFEVQFDGFVDLRGRPSSRGPQAGGREARGTLQLDRDMRVRIRRRV